MEEDKAKQTEEMPPYMVDFPIRDEDLESSFKYDIAHEVGGEGLLRCLKCGACSGGCPVGAVIDYRPRKVLGNVLLGLKEMVLSSDDIWLCAACFTCEERCVQEVNFTDVVTVLRNLASKAGYAASGYIELAKRVMEHGRVTPRSRTVDKHREKLGLPPLQDPAIEELNKIMEASGFREVIDASEGRVKSQ
jgi:heterodisulfide reductase subunit C